MHFTFIILLFNWYIYCFWYLLIEVSPFDDSSIEIGVEIYFFFIGTNGIRLHPLIHCLEKLFSRHLPMKFLEEETSVKAVSAPYFVSSLGSSIFIESFSRTRSDFLCMFFFVLSNSTEASFNWWFLYFQRTNSYCQHLTHLLPYLIFDLLH